MKRNFTYLLPLFIALSSGCLSKVDKVDIPPLTVPQGSFAGTFTRLHITTKTGVVDSATANLNIKFDASGNYTVSGDTSNVHAGSFGKCILGVGNDLVFTDKTYSTNGTSKKEHLNGDYLYSYDGSILELLKGVGDTISYQYRFDKTSQ